MSDDFENMLSGRDKRTYEVRKKAQYESQQTEIQTADKGASMFDFIKMVHKLSTMTLSDLGVEFVPDENKKVIENADVQLDHPLITYKVISRKPKKELKPRVRQDIRETADNPDDERFGQVWGQKFDCHIQFNVFASVYETAEQVMERFEEMIFRYAGYMKQNGVAEILFEEQLTDANYDMFRQTISVRNLRYHVEVEKQRVLFQETIKEIETLGL